MSLMTQSYFLRLSLAVMSVSNKDDLRHFFKKKAGMMKLSFLIEVEEYFYSL